MGVCPALRHDALKPMLHCGLEECRSVALEMLADAERMAVLADECVKLVAAGDEFAASQILAVELEQIESKEHEPARVVDNRPLQGIEIGNAVLVLDHDLAVDEG